jgi:hypothetical protein
VREFGFELALCAHLAATAEELVSRQLGVGVERPGGRIVDVVGVEPGPGFADRAAITPETIPDAAIRSDAGPGRFRQARRVIEGSPRRRRRVVERAVEAEIFERERRGGREYVRQVARYPGDWFGRIVGIENKPDLGTPGALETQLRKDVSLALVDEAILATESHVTGAHLNRIPEDVGVWRVDPTHDPVDVEVIREPTPLDASGPGIEILDERPGETEIYPATAAEKVRARRRLAERAYGKGWRSYEFPDCAAVAAADREGVAGLPYCEWKGRLIDPASECGPDCPGFEAADAPEVDLAAARADDSPWVADPEGRRRRQAGLDRFADDG